MREIPLPENGSAGTPALPEKNGPFRLLVALLILAALGGGAWFFWMRPSALEKGRRALDRGDADAAVQILSKRLDKGAPPAEELDLRRELARAYLTKGSFDDAEQALRAVLDKNPDDAYADLALGFLFFSRGQDAFAADLFRKAKALAPGDLRASRGLAALFNLRGENDKAREEALDLLNKAPTDPLARFELGRAELGRGLFADAAQAFESVLQANAGDAAARESLVRARLEAGDLKGSEEALAPLLQKSPDDPAALSLQADYFMARARPADAEALYQKIFERDGRRLFAGVAWARSLARRRETDRAESLLMDIAQRLPKQEDVPPPPYSSFYEPWDTLELRRSIRQLRVDFNLAMAEVYRARYLAPDAERQVRLALQMDPRDVEALRTLTDLKRASGDVPEWLKAASDAAQAFPEHPAVLLDKALALLAAKRPQEALTFAQGAAAACPALARAQGILAEVRLALHEKEPASQSVAKALDLNPGDPEALFADGLLKARSEDWKGAEAAFALAVDADGASARAHWERARALDRLGKKRQAQSEKEAALALEPRVYAGKK